MAEYTAEKTSSAGSGEHVPHHLAKDSGAGGNAAYVLDENRRAALREIDEAAFSCVISSL